MASYLVTIATDSNQACLELCLNNMCIATKKRQVQMKNHLGTNIQEKPYGGRGASTYVRGLIIIEQIE